MSEPRQHNPYGIFKAPNIRRFIIGSTLVRVGAAVQGLVIGWEVYDRTDEPFALGFVALIQAIPMLALTLLGGVLADRFNRRRIVLISMFATMLTSIGLGIASWHELGINWMYGLLFMDACALSLTRPSRMALIPRIVPRDQFEEAIKWRSSLGQMAAVGGPALGGLLARVSVPSAYFFCAFTQGLFVITLLRIHLLPAPERESKPANLKSVLEGVRFIREHPIILTAISLDLFAVLLGGAVYLLPIFAKDILEVGKTGLGILRAAPAFGALITALFLAHMPPMKRAGRNLLLCVAGFGVATIVFGISKSFWLSAAMLMLTGMFDNVSVIIRHTLVQMRTPDEMRGRVSAVNMVFIGSSNEIGGFESGTVAHFFGPVISVVSGGIGTLVVVLVTAWVSPAMRKFGRLVTPESDQADEADPAAPGDEAPTGPENDQLRP